MKGQGQGCVEEGVPVSYCYNWKLAAARKLVTIPGWLRAPVGPVMSLRFTILALCRVR